MDRPSVKLTPAGGATAVRLASGGTEATFLPAVGMLGTSLRRGNQEFLALPGGLAAYRARHATGLPLLAQWANRLGAWGYRAAGADVELKGLDLPRVELRHGSATISLSLVEAYPFLQIFAPPGRRFVCLEPMTAPVDALRSGRCPLVRPGDESEARFSVSIGSPAQRTEPAP